jgi:hypothetical protein
MARFYLSVRNGQRLIRDPRSYRFASAQAARDATVRTVREFLAANPQDHAFDEKRIEIANETGHPVALVDIDDVCPLHLTPLGLERDETLH